jgi:type I restriction enzyme, S subunit
MDGARLPKGGDVLITTEAPLGETAQIQDEEIALAQRIILLKVDKPLMTNGFLRQHLSSAAGKGELWSRATGSTAIGIKVSHLREIAVPVPPIQEQLSIAVLLDAETAKIDALAAKVREHIEKLQEYRTALISAAVTGKIDVR